MFQLDDERKKNLLELYKKFMPHEDDIDLSKLNEKEIEKMEEFYSKIYESAKYCTCVECRIKWL